MPRPEKNGQNIPTTSEDTAKAKLTTMEENYLSSVIDSP